MSVIVGKTVDVLDCYEGRDAAITFTLYLCCLLSGYYPRKSSMHKCLQRIFKRLEDARVVLRLYDDIAILRDFFTYELRPGERNNIVRFLKCLHYISWLCYYPSEHILWLGQMKMIKIDADLWDFYTNFFWASALLTSALWNAYVVLQYMTQKTYSKEKEEEEKKSFIPWTASRNAMLASIRDGTEFMVAVHYLPQGYLWASTLTYIQVGLFGTCSASLRLYALFKFQEN
ncbi:unnamed protein product [Adineta steineri]|uniref:Uncharacterized protein n=1 Tax=Adineta steineri TaxID=433720 RepID=A0A815E3Q5_9BILA|nr:unnamed protein product [Adineta steineri]CAF0910912.1 unnamed protein product [Adineta steineri]CAF0950305.1 unnamed protein product [Adineta steineri]CAF0972226.1 unnamed protein product [Adineta steineri]CAF1305085.1 unnamed protein product [Adineta steineri]